MRLQGTNTHDMTITKFLGMATYALVLLMPFHAAIVVILGTWLGSTTLVAAWKELLIVTMALGLLVHLTRGRTWHTLYQPIPLTIAAITLLGLIVSLLNHTSLTSLAFGIKTDIFPWLLFLCAAAATWPGAKSQYRFVRLVVIGAVIVSLISLLQVYLIPVSLLTALGYGPATIPALQKVNAALPAIRAFSTLGGPNQLGSYLLIPLCLVGTLILRRKHWRLLALLPLLLAALYLSYSRSAWIAAIFAAGITGFLGLPHKWRLIAPGIVLVCVGLAAGLTYRVTHNREVSPLELVLLHGQVDRLTDKVTDSDSGRTSSLALGLATLKSRPLGLGLGSAGPASYQTAHPLITENWYLQVGIELGWLGVALYTLLFGLIARQLWQLSSQSQAVLAPGLLAALGGILISNLFLHSLADSTLAIMLCGTLGIALGNMVSKETSS